MAYFCPFVILIHARHVYLTYTLGLRFMDKALGFAQILLCHIQELSFRVGGGRVPNAELRDLGIVLSPMKQGSKIPPSHSRGLVAVKITAATGTKVAQRSP